MSNIDKRADSVSRIIADLKLKHGSGDTYAPIMRWDELLALLDELEAKDSMIAAQQHEIRTLLNALEGRPCPKCNDTGMADSGGTQPWGEPISVPCDCAAPPAPVSVPEAAPVAYIFKHPAGRLFWSLTDESNKGQSDVMPVYAAPVPAFVPPAIEPDYEVIKGILPTANPDEYACCIAADMWNACRAAMLQGAEPVTTAYKLPEETGSSLQLRNLIRQRHAEWSQATFGDVGPVGPLKHLSKEALEAAEEPDDLSEWADMQFLLWDAQRRAGISDGEITAAMEEKLKVNMARQWPEPKDGEPRLHIKAAPQQEVKP